jgi:hydrogenase small subunit
MTDRKKEEMHELDGRTAEIEREAGLSVAEEEMREEIREEMQEDAIDRRTVLKGMGATAAAMAGSSFDLSARGQNEQETRSSTIEPATATSLFPDVHVLWISAALGCDGDSVSVTSATNPPLEAVLTGAIPGLPKVVLHNQILATEYGDDFMKWFYMGAAGQLEPFVLVVEGSIPDETNKEAGYWAGFGTDKVTGQPILTTTWINQLTPHATAVIAVGTCATWGGIPSSKGNPTGAMGLSDFVGWNWLSKAGLPIINIPGCPVLGDNFMEVLVYLLSMLAGSAPTIPLDDLNRPTWLFAATVHEKCSRAGHYEQAEFDLVYGRPDCLVKIGCWGPIVHCNVPQRGWINGVGGCTNVGGICIGCTMPGFPDHYQPFMTEPPPLAAHVIEITKHAEGVMAERQQLVTQIESMARRT